MTKATETKTIVGNVTTDPQLRYTPSGKAVTDVRVAVNHRAKTDDGAWIDAGTDYYTAPAWETEAENVVETIRKGTRVVITGSAYRRTWTDADGAQRYETVIDPIVPIAITLDFQRATVTRHTRRPETGE